ncbi:MAG: hypothetical protein JWL95_1985 [Gemmatimonadetes bacterium]|nr:hypothetical protein [Gemmatimonadota bacterium]
MLAATVALLAAASRADGQSPVRNSPRVDATSATQSTRSSALTSISRSRLQQVLGPAAALRVVRASGVTDLAPSAPSVSVAPGEFVFRKMADTARRIARGPADSSNAGKSPVTYSMPYRWMTVDSAGVERVLMPYFIILGGGLSYDVGTRMYRGLALVGVEDTLHQSAEPFTLIRPLRMQLATMRGGRISPVQLAIAHTSLDYDSVRIESPDSTFVRIRTGADPAGIVVPIPVLGLAVAMTPQQPRLQGFGLATTDIGISLPRGMARTDTATVSFSASGSPVRPGTVRVSGAEGATVRVRSGRLGTNVIQAVIDGVPVGHTEVTSEPPISFVVATLLGILLGGAARFVGAKRRKRMRSLPWDIARGAPFGLLAAIASAIGLDLVQLKLSEPGALPAIVVTAALGAWLGAKILERGATPRVA